MNDYEIEICKNMIYEDICSVISDYESGNADGEDLYDILVEIQNQWDDVITARRN